MYIADQVLLMHLPPDGSDDADRFGRVVLEWQSSPTADCTADAIIAVLLQEQGKPVAIGAAEEERKCAPRCSLRTARTHATPSQPSGDLQTRGADNV